MQLEPDLSLPPLSGYTLFVSCVSVGNVGQLAMDVILATLQKEAQLKLVSQANHPSVIPMCGADPILVSHFKTPLVVLYKLFHICIENLYLGEQSAKLCHATLHQRGNEDGHASAKVWTVAWNIRKVL